MSDTERVVALDVSAPGGRVGGIRKDGGGFLWIVTARIWPCFHDENFVNHARVEYGILTLGVGVRNTGKSGSKINANHKVRGCLIRF